MGYYEEPIDYHIENCHTCMVDSYYIVCSNKKDYKTLKKEVFLELDIDKNVPIGCDSPIFFNGKFLYMGENTPYFDIGEEAYVYLTYYCFNPEMFEENEKRREEVNKKREAMNAPIIKEKVGFWSRLFNKNSK